MLLIGLKPRDHLTLKDYKDTSTLQMCQGRRMAPDVDLFEVCKTFFYNEKLPRKLLAFFL